MKTYYVNGLASGADLNAKAVSTSELKKDNPVVLVKPSVPMSRFWLTFEDRNLEDAYYKDLIENSFRSTIATPIAVVSIVYTTIFMQS
jgi:hypothetical protein